MDNDKNKYKFKVFNEKVAEKFGNVGRSVYLCTRKMQRIGI